MARAITGGLQRIGSGWLKAMAFDNGQEFAHHMDIARRCKVKTFFTRPYTAQDKGIVGTDKEVAAHGM